MSRDYLTYDEVRELHRHQLQAALNATIEECARVADRGAPDPMAVFIAKTIRALKDKP